MEDFSISASVLGIQSDVKHMFLQDQHIYAFYAANIAKVEGKLGIHFVLFHTKISSIFFSQDIQLS